MPIKESEKVYLRWSNINYYVPYLNRSERTAAEKLYTVKQTLVDKLESSLRSR